MDLNLNNNDNKLKLKKKKVRSSITTTTSDDCLPPSLPPTGINSTTSFLTDDDFFVYEILTRLPVKSLFRFKTVSKEWSSLIEKDQNFIDLHLTLSKTHHPCRIFIVVPVPLTEEEEKERNPWAGIDYWPYKEFYITADLLFEDNGTTMKAVVDTVWEVDSRNYDMITEPVNGLFCSIESQLEHAVRICNITTRQVSPLFPTTLLEEPKYTQYGVSLYPMKYRYQSFVYGFGFDPATNKHKLVCVWYVRPHDDDDDSDDDDRRFFICEVLTLGRQGGINTWRTINDVPPDGLTLTDESVYVNGVIYWNTFRLQRGSWDSKTRPVYIVAFDVGKEKFRTITLPDLTLGGAPQHFRNDLRYDTYVNLLKVSGCLAMLVKVNHSVFKMYIHEDDDNKKEEKQDINEASTRTSFSNNNNDRWIEVRSITLPLDSEENRVKFHTFIGSDDKIIITFYDRGDCGKKVGPKKCSSFYCLNWKNDSWTEFEISGIPSSVPHICFRSSFTTFSESLLAVNNQASPS